MVGLPAIFFCVYLMDCSEEKCWYYIPGFFNYYTSCSVFAVSHSQKELIKKSCPRLKLARGFYFINVTNMQVKTSISCEIFADILLKYDKYVARRLIYQHDSYSCFTHDSINC